MDIDLVENRFRFVAVAAAGEEQQRAADLHAVARAERSPLHFLAVDPGAVGALQIDDFELASFLEPELGMAAGGLVIAQLDGVGGVPANELLLRQIVAAALISSLNDEQRSHRGTCVREANALDSKTPASGRVDVRSVAIARARGQPVRVVPIIGDFP